MQDVAQSRDPYIDAATASIRSVLERQYPALRAYGMMSGKTRVRLEMTIDFEFSPTSRQVFVTAKAVPPATEDSAEVHVHG